MANDQAGHGKRLLQVGIAGAGVTALCCFTPLLAVMLGMLGLASWLAWLDYLLLPLLAFFIALSLFAWIRYRKRPAKEA